MKFQICIVLACVFLQIFAINNPNMGKLTYTQKKNIDKLRHQKTWASFILDLAELHLASGGPLDQLSDAVQEISQDLENKVEKAHQDYDYQTEQHNSEVNRIKELISSANSDISATTTYINDVLFTQQMDLTKEISQLEKSIENTRQYISDENAIRIQEHEQYIKLIQETQLAIQSIQEAQQVLDELKEGSTVSLIQTRTFNSKINIVNNKLKKGTDRAMLTALANVASNSQFADKDSVQKVAQLMREVEQNLLDANTRSSEKEEKEQENFEKDMENKTNDLKKMIADLGTANENLSQTERAIEDNQEFLELRQRDLKDSEQQLEEENENFEEITERYNELLEQLAREQKAVQTVLDHLEHSEIADYIGGRIEEDVVIDQQHGAGITVETNPLDLE